MGTIIVADTFYAIKVRVTVGSKQKNSLDMNNVHIWSWRFYKHVPI